jgi:hypothetical protein
MQMIKGVKLCGIAAVLAFCASCGNGNTQKITEKGDSVLLTVKAIPVDSGWGYEIYVGNRLYIKQNIVPQAVGIHHFLTEADAKRAADLVIKKLKQNQIPSTDTLELQAAGARYK